MTGSAARIPVNLITGFLGVGKTTAVRHLLAQRPAGETWGVLVNEFGEIGVDGGLLAGQTAPVQEVAGGCLCCVAAPAFTTGLNRLVRQHRPDRILIEPSGLGHPAQVLETLSGPLYATVLDVRATVCLLDIRHLASPRHREHPTFQDQLHLADVLVANKIDLVAATEQLAFEAFAAELRPPKQCIAMVEHGMLDPAWLDLGRSAERRAAFPEAHAFLVESGMPVADGLEHSDEDWLRIEGRGDGYHRVGWLIRQATPCDASMLTAGVDNISAERKKGVFLTDKGWRSVNQSEWGSTDTPADGRSRLQVIDPSPIDALALDAGLRRLLRANCPTSSVG
ncbi:MAG: GTP-binding protein [Sedimenticolaceae bacterium]